MVKIPGLDDLKKMGGGLLDSAKSVKLGEMMDKLKAGVESVSGKGPLPQGDEAIKNLFHGIYTSLNELMEQQAADINAIKKIQGQVAELARVIEASQKSTTASTPAATTQTDKTTNKPEDKK